MKSYTLPALTRALNERGFSISSQVLRNRLFEVNPPNFSQKANGRYLIKVADETELMSLAYSLAADKK